MGGGDADSGGGRRQSRLGSERTRRRVSVATDRWRMRDGGREAVAGVQGTRRRGRRRKKSTRGTRVDADGRRGWTAQQRGWAGSAAVGRRGSAQHRPATQTEVEGEHSNARTRSLTLLRVRRQFSVQITSQCSHFRFRRHPQLSQMSGRSGKTCRAAVRASSTASAERPMRQREEDELPWASVRVDVGASGGCEG